MTAAEKTGNAARVSTRDTLAQKKSRRHAKPVDRSLAIAAPIVLGIGAAIAACAGPPMTSAIEDEPVCPDFEIGAAHTKMAGGLRYPVQLVIKSGSNVVFKTTIVGRRTDKDPAARFLLADDNETYSVEWLQCENERASKPAESAGRDQKGIAKYECGNATSYKTEQLATKKGDPSSHTLHFPAPPNAACFQTVAAQPSASASASAAAEADAGAPDAAADDAGATTTDAGADADGGAPSADAGATGQPSATPDAGSDAGASKAK